MKLTVHLDRRALVIREDGGAEIDLGSGTRAPYDSTQDAVRRAADVIVRHCNCVDRAGMPALDRLAGLVERGELELELSGDPRECYVAALHFWVVYGVEAEGLPWSRGGRGGIKLTAVTEGPSFYDTYGFGADLATLEEVAALVDEWRLIVSAGRTFERADELRRRVRAALGYTRAQAQSGRPERIRIGILGATGAGKSSFINAALGRYVTPTSEKICSACVIEIVHAPSEERAYFEVTPVPAERRRDRIKEAKRAVKRASSLRTDNAPERRAVAERELRALQDADAKVRRVEGDRLGLERLQEFVQVSDVTRTHELIAKVVVRLHQPLLANVTLVDTPGLRDPDETRRRMAIDELTRLDGWLYLVEGNVKQNLGIKADLDEIAQQANHETGVLIVTKADGIGSQAGSVAESARVFLDSLAREPVSWAGPRTWCAARPVAMAAEVMRAGDADWAALASAYERHGVLSYANRVGEPVSGRRPPSRQLMPLLDLAAESADPGLRQGLMDYLLDLSRVPAVIRALAEGLAQHALRRRRDRGLELLLTDVETHVEAGRETVELQGEHLRHVESVEHARAEQARIRASIDELDRRLRAARQQLSRFSTEVAVRRIDETLDAFCAHAATLFSPMLEDLDKKVTKDAEWRLRGALRYSMFDTFDGPLAQWCRQQVRRLRVDLCGLCSVEVTGVDAAVLAKETLAELEGYSVHREPLASHEVRDFESLWERFAPTTMPRMRAAAKEMAAKNAAEIALALKEKCDALRARIHDLASMTFATDEQRRIELQRALDDLVTDTQTSEHDGALSREVVEKRVALLTERQARMEGFARKLEGVRPARPTRTGSSSGASNS